jgi:hypothetical protein
MAKMQDLQQVEVKSVQALRQWLEENHGQPDSIWLVTYKTYKKNVPLAKRIQTTAELAAQNQRASGTS